MKTRCRFVSNSSSSSFILVFATIKDNQENIAKELFGDKNMVKLSKAKDSDYYDPRYKSLNVSDIYDEHTLIENVDEEKYVLTICDYADIYPEYPGGEEYLAENHEEAEDLCAKIYEQKGIVFDEVNSYTWAGYNG